MSLKIGAKMSKLDTFNKDKVKCEKCKEYYDDCSETWKVPRSWYPLLCDDCYDKWFKQTLRSFFIPDDADNLDFYGLLGRSLSQKFYQDFLKLK